MRSPGSGSWRAVAADHVLAIDQGTTSTRAILFDSRGHPVATAQQELTQHYPQLGWVEHDADEIWQAVVETMRGAIARSGVAIERVASIGVTNQRETTVVWDRATGEPIHRAIVWQDRRTSDTCARLKADGAEALVQARTGLLLDPYFSATKIAWMIDAVPGARDRAGRGELAFGTIDSFLLWRLTGGSVHATDVTNASRTSLFDIRVGAWDHELCRLFAVPIELLPDVRDNSGLFGATTPDLLGQSIPIAGMAGDQQAALVGQGCFEPGMAKATYGTGCFMLMNTGPDAIESHHRLLTTPAYRLGGATHYALEGSIFVAGAAIKWLRDGLGLIADAAETGGMATRVPDSHGVYLVPAFVGMGAPHWEPDARGAIYGLTLDASAAHIARAALEAVAYQTFDLIQAMTADGSAAPALLRIDGGMTANTWLCQLLTDVLQVPVQRPAQLETTAVGAAYLAGLATGIWDNVAGLPDPSQGSETFEPRLADSQRQALIDGWSDAVARTLRRAPA